MTKNSKYIIATPDAHLLVEEDADHALSSIVRLMACHAAREVFSQSRTPTSSSDSELDPEEEEDSDV